MNEPSSLPPRDAGDAELSDTDLESVSDRLCADLVDRWRRGERVPVEAYIRQHPELQSGDTFFELVLTEVILRQTNGELTPLDEYLWRFPQFEERLRRHFTLHEELRLSEPTISGLTAVSGEPPLSPTQAVPVPIIPGYEILGELGRGGMGVVFKARDIRLGRRVAMKFLPIEFTTDRQRLDRFLREARTASGLNHPHICTVHALGEFQDQPFIVMEFIDGITVQKMLDQRPGVEETVRIFGQAAQALAAAHESGVVHRDIKPENIMVRDDRFVKVVDFGLARRLPTLAETGPPGSFDTDPGTLLGTVSFMSPEQAQGQVADSASDVFSLGVVLYLMLTGKHPFAAESALDTLHAIVKEPAISPARLNPEVPKSLEALVTAMLHKAALLRPTAAQVATSLEMLGRGGVSRAAKAAQQPLVQRHRELTILRQALESADVGRGTMLCVVGEPGIGKSTLVETLLDELTSAGRDCFVACGRCSERLVGSDAYQPVIDALEDLLRTETGETAARLMKVVAPTWYSRISPVSSAASGSAEPSRASSQQSMLREFGDLLEEASRLGPVVLFFDDVHWADISTVALLAHIGRICRNLRVLVVVTYRPTEMLLGPHAFHGVKQELQVHGTCREIFVGFFERQDIDQYLSLVYPGHAFPADFAALVYARTEGSPLFMADLLRYLQARGVIGQANGQWSLAQNMPDLRQELPESVRSMIQRKLERIDPEDRRLLTVASVQGHEFDSAVVAGTLKRDAADVEERLQALDQIHGLVRLVRESEFPDRTLTLRYAFVHILYQQALYSDLQPTRRSILSTALAETLERYHSERSSAAAAELACLYEVGRNFSRAARQLHLAAQNAAQVFAHREAIALAERGLRLLNTVTDSQERAGLELPLLTVLGMQLQVTQGFAAPEAHGAYCRARELCWQVRNPSLRFPVLWGLWLHSKVRSELVKAQEMAEELSVLARQLCDPSLALQSHQALGMTAFCRGLPGEAVGHVEQASTLYDSQRHRNHAHLFGQDPSVMCKSFGAIALWQLGFADQAVRQATEAVRLSRDHSPSSQAIALHFAAMLHQLLRDPVRVLQFTEASTTIAAEHGFSFWLAGGTILKGWAIAASGQSDEGIEQIQNGLQDWNATGSVTYKTYYLGLLAEALGDQGRVDEARKVIDDALALAAATEEGLCEPELHRLRGELLLKNSDGTRVTDAAQNCFQQGLAVARQQQSVGYELRTAISATRQAQREGRANDADLLLRPVCDKLTEGFQTADYVEARQLLANS